ELLAAREPRRVSIDHECGDASLKSLACVSDGEHHRDIGYGGIRYKCLGSIDPPPAGRALGARQHAKRIGSRARFRDRVGADQATIAQSRQILAPLFVVAVSPDRYY